MQHAGDFERRYTLYGFLAIAVLALVAAGYFLAPFFPALLWAVVFSVLTFPLYRRVRDRLEKRLRLSPTVAGSAGAGVAVLFTFFVILFPLGAIGALLGHQVTTYLEELRMEAPQGQSVSLESFLARVDETLRPITRRLGVEVGLARWFSENRDTIFAQIRAPLGRVILSAGYTVFTIFTALLTMFFLLRDGHMMRRPALELIPLPPERAWAIIVRMGDTIHGVFMGVVLVAIIQGTLAGLAYWVCGVPLPLVWGFATMILCVIPLLGAPVIYVPWSAVLIAQGRYAEGFGLLAFGFLVVSQIDNFLRPYFIGRKVELHYMAVFFSLLGGVLLLGPVGIMAGPVLLTVLLALQETVREWRQIAGSGGEQAIRRIEDLEREAGGEAPAARASAKPGDPATMQE